MVELCRAALDLPEDAAEAAAIVPLLSDPDPTVGRRPVALVGRPAPATVSPSTGTLAPTGAAGGAPVGVLLGSISHTNPTVGHVELLAVHPSARRRGLGRALLERAELVLAGLGAREVVLAGNPPRYAWPGIDVRYTPAICTALALGYEQYRTAWNMTADLSAPDAPGLRDTAPAERRLAGQGVTVRRAEPADLPALVAFAEEVFGGSWPGELTRSVGRPDAGCHLAVRDGKLLAFAAWGSSRPTWFGPTGTAPAAQGLGIGSILLRRCLADQRAAGHDRVQIGWVGPVPFYSRTVGARIERVFSLYRKPLVGAG
ncbi:GNAT family N-acetyltransferase [Micromonospora zhanjiangensis]|uniref:GNAT family N-acetyltransferase n=1 Tax=Micromonospora zhanjiangensis TaxID=1522057 RepID=A0ABV8KEV9_9ACTN